ncbi:protein ccc1 [Zygosaccharomyces mellis]|uniref:Protein ccc1 n=1 Tax=Zygosaccharomyces mellis TaxID=42258 RepID=A0A4C2E3D7_9SACH|nr:protein ccc1 [Zygosaccharomyces mellis]
MSIVAIKNAVSEYVSSRKDSNKTAPLLTNDNGSHVSQNVYGSINGDLENGNGSSSQGNATGKNNSSGSDRDVDSLGGSSDNNNDNNNNNNNNNNNSSHGGGGLFNRVDPRVISDLVIGLSDGLTVPFALTAGLSSLGNSKLVITGGFAELISGAISMGLGGYLGAKSEGDYYHAEVKQEKSAFYDNPTMINHEIEDILLEINPNFSDETILSFIKDLQRTPELMVDFIIRYGRGLEEPAENRQLVSAATIGGGYLMGGLVPLLPYFFVQHVGTGLIWSIIVMGITLFWFGYLKTQVSMSDACTLGKKVSEGLQMVVVGGVAAGAAFLLVKTLG